MSSTFELKKNLIPTIHASHVQTDCTVRLQYISFTLIFELVYPWKKSRLNPSVVRIVQNGSNKLSQPANRRYRTLFKIYIRNRAHCSNLSSILVLFVEIKINPPNCMVTLNPQNVSLTTRILFTLNKSALSFNPDTTDYTLLPKLTAGLQHALYSTNRLLVTWCKARPPSYLSDSVNQSGRALDYTTTAVYQRFTLFAWFFLSKTWIKTSFYYWKAR